MVAVTLALAGCLHSRPADLHFTPPAAHGAVLSGDWWIDAGDQVLARLVAQGLANSASLACEAAAGHIGAVRARRRGDSAAEASYRYADHRARIAAAIAHAYIDVRRWQALLALRTTMIGQYRDNTEIAEFRREAGLASAIDGSVAGALSGQNAGARDRSYARLAADLAALARLAGIPADDLKLQLGNGTQVPDLVPPAPLPDAARSDPSSRADLLALQSHLERRLARAKVSQATLDQALASPGGAAQASPAQVAVTAWRQARAAAQQEIGTLTAALAAADTHIQDLSGHEPAAHRAVADARLAYRAGAGDFATLFVTEVAALGLQEALVEARADRAAVIVDLRTALGQGRPADLAPAVVTAGATRGLACD